jgi:hypothetical protein
MLAREKAMNHGERGRLHDNARRIRGRPSTVRRFHRAPFDSTPIAPERLEISAQWHVVAVFAPRLRDRKESGKDC